ncbi:methyltransferase protein [Ceratobasidium sp. 414]|nr:methyltransferase protein [Ceratobasidium sp. 414]
MSRSTYSRFVSTSIPSQEAKPGVGDHVSSDDLKSHIDDALAASYDSVALYITNDRWKDRWQNMCLSQPGAESSRPDTPQEHEATSRVKVQNTESGNLKIVSGPKDAESLMEAELWRAGGGFRREELNIIRNDQAEYVTGFASDWLELDSLEEGVRFDSEIALRQELQFASYLGMANIILPAPRRNHQITSYARTISDCLSSSSIASYINFSVRIPICDVPPEEGSGAKGVAGHEDELSTTWEMWNTIRMVCGPTQRISVALDLTPALPASPGILARWAAEPIQHVILPATTFISNAKGYPVLPKLIQSFLRDVLKNRLNIILSQTTSKLHKLGGELAYAQYVRHLEKTSPTAVAREAASGLTVESFGRGYEDYLQAPLQPLMDNLASVTYEIFEKDPVKYRQYEQGDQAHLLGSLPSSIRPASSRGYLAQAGAQLSPTASVPLEEQDVKLGFTLWKRIPTHFLQGRKAREWPDNVFIKFGDMRSVQLPEPVDILVSELLGSFGDNELSPECLDGAMRLLKPEGISIPASYTAYLAPLSASMLYNDPSATLRETKGAETPYVVMLHAVNSLSEDGGDDHPRCGARIQDCWDFEHPRIHNVVLDPQGKP